MKLLKIEKSSRLNKRLVAIFEKDNGKLKKVHFGLKNPKKGTYIDTGDKELRKNYRTRHQRDLKTKDPSRAGYLSYYLLWGDSKSLKENIKSYKKQFNL